MPIECPSTNAQYPAVGWLRVILNLIHSGVSCRYSVCSRHSCHSELDSESSFFRQSVFSLSKPLSSWIPAFAGMTQGNIASLNKCENLLPEHYFSQIHVQKPAGVSRRLSPGHLDGIHDRPKAYRLQLAITSDPCEPRPAGRLRPAAPSLQARESLLSGSPIL